MFMKPNLNSADVPDLTLTLPLACTPRDLGGDESRRLVCAQTAARAGERRRRRLHRRRQRGRVQRLAILRIVLGGFPVQETRKVRKIWRVSRIGHLLVSHGRSTKARLVTVGV